MKKQNSADAKKARKAFKKEVTEKIIVQIKTAIGAELAESKKTGKAIEKAAKKISKLGPGKKNAAEATAKTEAAIAAPTDATITVVPKPVKAKAPAVKKATA